MIPIRDENPTRSRAWMTLLLILVNVGISLLQWLLPGSESERLLLTAALIPARLTGLLEVPGLPAPLTLLSSQFLHGGFLHLAGNMLFLWIFGNNVEDELGSLRFLVFYLACGTAAGLVHTMTGPGSGVPTVGASGAISGVLGAYAFLFPRARIHSLLFLFFYVTVIPLPALVWVAIWFAIQLINGLATQGVGSGVAWFAHVGGLVAGIVLLVLFRRRRPRPRAHPFSGTWNRW
ncbi:MAG: rhomboid family intramembrane serine protease [Candidatus Eisenbacteria bacterium]|nr:rhomboid family intramembrane serine protease [Candidatus Latescibacterota bacterium]MBD3301362.1 rhomboid family intramembrane serine protease [Candidatus Eisenbacteria bacterium]